MAWFNGYRIDGGLLAGAVFENGGEMDDVTWQNPPNPSATSFVTASAIDMNEPFAGVNCLVAMRDRQAGEDVFLWSINIIDSNFYKAELRCKIHFLNNNGGFEMSLIRRAYTDESTYTDITLGTRATGFHFNESQVETIVANAIFFQSSYRGTSYFYIGFSWKDYIYWSSSNTSTADGLCIPFSHFAEVLGGDLNPPEEFSPEYGDASGVGGGYNEDAEHGSFDDTSDTIPIPAMPTLSPISAGYFHAYYLADPETRLAWIGDALFPEDPLTQPDILSALGEVAQMLYFNKQIDYVVDCHVIPCIPTHGANVAIKVGGRELKTSQGGTEYTIQAPQITSGYVDYDCGKIQIKEYWKNFLDFSNGTRAKLFLPFVGYVDVLPEFFNGGELGVIYRFNVVDGSFMAFVTSSSGKSQLKESMIAQYSGNACMHIPLQSADYSRILGGIVSAVTTVAGASTGNMAVAGAGLVGSYTNLAGARPQMHSSNGYTASASYMSKRTPYLIIERAKSQFSKNYPNEIGLPLNVTRTLSSVHGFTIIENPVLNIDCNDNEYNEIVNLLKSGVIF